MVSRHQCGQTLGSLAEVHRRRRHQHPNRARRTDHVLAFKARSTAATVLASAPRPIRTLTPSISTSMLPALRSTWRVHLRGRPRDGRAGNAGSTTAGTNLGASASLATGWRACRRQVNTCCGVSPCRRATSETTAPGTSVSSTMPGLEILRELAPSPRPRNHLQPAHRCRLRLKRMVKRRHKPISDSEIAQSPIAKFR